MAKYKVEEIEQKTTSTGKTKADATLIGEDNVRVERVTIWADFPNFATLAVGGYVTGTLRASADPKYGPTLYTERVISPAGGGRTGMSTGIAKAQETKRDDIKDAQERKNEAIQLAGAFRDATLVSLQALRDNPFPTDEEYKAEWTKWCKWFLQQGDQPFI